MSFSIKKNAEVVVVDVEGQLIVGNRQELKQKVLDELHLNLAPHIPVGYLGIGQQHLVEIAKALARNARILVLDEPTAALTDSEGDVLFADFPPDWMRQFSILLIETHTMIAADNLHFGEFLRCLHRQAAQPDSSKQLKNRCVCANSYGKQQNCSRRKSGTFAELPQRVSEVLE